MAGISAAFVLAVGACGAETARIAAFGDSLVHGYGLHQEDGLVPQLNEWLRIRRVDAIVENAGVSGDTTAGGAARIGWTLASGPDAIIIVLGGNDLLRGIDPAESRRNLDYILAQASSQNVKALLVGHEAPPNYGPVYKQRFEAMFQELAELHNAALFKRIFDPLDEQGEREAVRMKFMQADGLHPNRDGIAVIVEALGPMVASLAER